MPLHRHTAAEAVTFLGKPHRILGGRFCRVQFRTNDPCRLYSVVGSLGALSDPRWVQHQVRHRHDHDVTLPARRLREHWEGT